MVWFILTNISKSLPYRLLFAENGDRPVQEMSDRKVERK
jgi:hypothetical protein